MRTTLNEQQRDDDCRADKNETEFVYSGDDSNKISYAIEINFARGGPCEKRKSPFSTPGQ